MSFEFRGANFELCRCQERWVIAIVRFQSSFVLILLDLRWSIWKLKMLNAKLKNISECLSPRSTKCNFWEPLQAKKGWMGKVRDLSTSLNNLWERGPTKGYGALKRPAPLCRCLFQNSSNYCEDIRCTLATRAGSGVTSATTNPNVV